MRNLSAVTHLTKIFNKCLALHHFPATWKLAYVLIFPKPHQDPKLICSYRPISLSRKIGKLYEKILLKRINEHCNNKNIIPNEQFGFRERHSCTHELLLRVTNKSFDGFNIKHYPGGVFLDVRKDLDRIWHQGLIVQLITYKFPGYLVLILRSFLTDRKF
ncbi:putative RNA-directed DNA polymerase from transposon X-element [Araneus ventricosus]|uniref:Putative RNA-directed DNA polymerase from transposon X-element n=1 Tax=Araneus ventricosus TaxID=182803 RepID=A0A4Y2J172_ARAVE|nr:putative RNA-directed DNA polymerase from transposon X-element [Araneus ventricosus]